MVEVNKRELLLLIVRLVLAWVFISAALPKIQDPIAFSASIDGYRIISGSTTLWAAIILPWLELIIGIGLLTPWLRRASAVIISSLLGLFIVLHASSWIRGLDINCGCFGANAGNPDYHWLIMRNLALLVMAVLITLAAFRNKKPSNDSI